MSHKNITLSIDIEVLRKFDEWRAGRPRGEAVALLLQSAPPTITAALSLAPKEVGTARAAAPDVGPSKQELKLALGAAVLRETETYVGVPPVVVEGEYVHKQDLTEEALRNREAFLRKEGQSVPPVRTHDPFNQDESYDGDLYAQDPPQDDVDQRAKRRGK